MRVDIASFYGSSCASNGKDALNTPEPVEEGSTVAVFGMGAVGLACIEGAVMAKAARIIAVRSVK
eukprot:1194194-Prorocentrum_minimum.AAC.1